MLVVLVTLLITTITTLYDLTITLFAGLLHILHNNSEVPPPSHLSWCCPKKAQP